MYEQFIRLVKFYMIIRNKNHLFIFFKLFNYTLMLLLSIHESINITDKYIIRMYTIITVLYCDTIRALL